MNISYCLKSFENFKTALIVLTIIFVVIIIIIVIGDKIYHHVKYSAMGFMQGFIEWSALSLITSQLLLKLGITMKVMRRETEKNNLCCSDQNNCYFVPGEHEKYCFTVCIFGQFSGCDFTHDLIDH